MDRNPDGTFPKGVSGNPNGRPKSDVDIIALIDSCVTATDWKNMIRKVKEKGLRGDLKCVEWLTDRRFGKVMQPIGGTGKDGALVITITERKNE